MFGKTLIFVYCITFGFALPTNSTDNIGNDIDDKSIDCYDVFGNAGMNYSSFWLDAAHGIHSLSLEEIRHFFKPDAPEDNKIPTVNIDFRSEDVIHFSAPLWGYEDRFDTWALKIMDWFMLNDKPYLYETGVNAMEKLSHQYHMQEIYTRAAKVYKMLVENPPTDLNLCRCANDVTANGILTEVINIAKQLKYRARTGRARTGCCESYDKYRKWGGCGCSGGGTILQQQKRSVLDEEEVSQLQNEYLLNSNEESASRLLKVSPWIPGNFKGPHEWISYSAVLTTSLPDDDGIKDFATFMYCKLNKPEEDHPADIY